MLGFSIVIMVIYGRSQLRQFWTLAHVEPIEWQQTGCSGPLAKLSGLSLLSTRSRHRSIRSMPKSGLSISNTWATNSELGSDLSYCRSGRIDSSCCITHYV